MKYLLTITLSKEFPENQNSDLDKIEYSYFPAIEKSPDEPENYQDKEERDACLLERQEHIKQYRTSKPTDIEKYVTSPFTVNYKVKLEYINKTAPEYYKNNVYNIDSKLYWIGNYWSKNDITSSFLIEEVQED